MLALVRLARKLPRGAGHKLFMPGHPRPTFAAFSSDVGTCYPVSGTDVRMAVPGSFSSVELFNEVASYALLRGVQY
eukprot:705750-Rhodomonas_salina.6